MAAEQKHHSNFLLSGHLEDLPAPRTTLLWVHTGLWRSLRCQRGPRRCGARLCCVPCAGPFGFGGDQWLGRAIWCYGQAPAPTPPLLGLRRAPNPQFLSYRFSRIVCKRLRISAIIMLVAEVDASSPEYGGAICSRQDQLQGVQATSTEHVPHT
ncbi:unnamed protein product [Polarella glacialis]|uniref:Uncharacterized protein n=1 Tax=Polarella glacialis TaxID=89957 RepID=A0A813L5A2_POLGL|nr:unnamed protein product [Polarella glacialis]